MNPRKILILLGPIALVLFCLPALVSWGGDVARPQKLAVSKPGRKTKASRIATGRRLRALLNDMLDMKDLQQPMTLKEALWEIERQLKDRYKEEDVFPVLIDFMAFCEDNPDAPDIAETQVKFQKFPRRLSVANALRLALSRVPTNNATYLIRRGVVEITTRERATPARLLAGMVEAQFDRTALDEALQELAEETGATIVLDTRLSEQLQRTPVSATFRNTVSLEAAVRLLAEMADLQVRREDGDALFVTEKEKRGGLQRGADLDIRNTPLDRALRQLAAWSHTTIVLDPRAVAPESATEKGPSEEVQPKPRARTLVSATFQRGTEGRAAARILAEMAGLDTVDVGNAVFVTSPEIAMQMRVQQRGK